jgi:hypothetical protein
MRFKAALTERQHQSEESLCVVAVLDDCSTYFPVALTSVLAFIACPAKGVLS